jgi:diguanylate cyclase (GGDEF)-like protein/putative nucleotidyltransferase with HDIG domain
VIWSPSPRALRGWLLRAGQGGLASVEGPGAMARFVGSLYVAGAALGLISMAFPQPRGSDVPALFALYGVALAIGATTLAARDRLQPLTLLLPLTTASVLVALGMLATDARTGVYAMFYVWIALTAAYFLTWTQVAIQAAFIAATYAAVLAIQRPDGAAEQWVIATGTVVVVCGLVGMLRRGVAGLFTRLADSARTDPLTELLNRRGFEELMEIELERSRRGESPLSLLVIDLDHFKAVNDEFGHPIGDRALRLFARALSETIRRVDRPARIGGEEFAVVLPDTEPHSAYLLAERLRRRLAEEVPAHPVRLSASIGVACSPRHGLTVSELMHAGDRALHAAKALGRDRAVMYDPEIVGSLIAARERGELRREENLAAVMVLAETLDIRDSGTARHSQTVAHLAAITARGLGMAPELVERVRLAGVLHDIGKIGVPDSILRKPGPLTEVEYAEMQGHTELGARIVAGANLEDISAWVLAHHERPDGRGYPNRLAGEDIPLEARILAVADSYEAMTSDRVYRLSIGDAAAQEELRRCAGTQFDANVVEALIAALAAEPAAPPAATLAPSA